MATIEMARSRSYHRSTGGEEQTRVYRIEGRPTDAATNPDIPQIGTELVDRPDLICVDVKADYMTKNDDFEYALVIVRYSTEQAILVNPGDMKFDYDFAAKTEQLSFAPRVQHEGDRYVDPVGVKRTIGQFGESVSVYRPSFALRVTKLFNKVMVGEVFSHLYHAAGKVNDAVWNGQRPHTMLFLGGDVPQTGQDRWTGTFMFAFDEGEHDHPWFKVNTQTKEVEGDAYWSELYLSYTFSNLNMEQEPTT